MKEALNEVLKDTKLQGGLDGVQVKEAWSDVMGSGVMAYTHAIDFRKGVLTVKLNSSVLREELSYGVDKMIVMLNEKLQKPLIKKIRLV